jgi:DNA gyrase subunit A
MATNMPSHNLREVAAAIAAYIDNPEISIDELCKYIKGPDFPTGGIIYGRDGIKKAYKTGRGKITIRS